MKIFGIGHVTRAARNFAAELEAQGSRLSAGGGGEAAEESSKRQVPGMIRRSLGDSKSHTGELRFFFLAYMRWGVVLSARVKMRA
jgi:hypothetical protein